MNPRDLPALLVVVPLVSGVLCPLLGRGRGGWWLAAAAAATTFAIAIGLARQVWNAGVISYPMGSWPAPFGIEYRVDALNAFVILVIAGIGAVVTAASRASVESEIPEDRRHLFWAVWLLCLTGLLGMTVTGDAFNVYVLLEISSLSTYALVAMGRGRDRRALTATMNYLVLGTVGASFLLLGIGYLYMATGTLNMADMSVRLSELFAQWDAGQPVLRRTVVAGFGFVMVGLCLKLALFPLHVWLPNAYTYAPSTVSALLAATATKVAGYVALRFLFTILGPRFSFGRMPTGAALMAMGCLAVVAGSWFALRQANLKRLLAYSSVAQIGYLAIGFGLANENGLKAGILHLLNHALMKGGMFLAVAAVVLRLGGAELTRLRGLGRRMPLTMAAFVAGGLGLIGVPLTGGFVSKWFLVRGILDAGFLAPAVIVLAGSLLAVAYVWRVVEVAYFTPAPADAPPVREAPPMLLAMMWLLVGGAWWFGTDARLPEALAARAAGVMLGTGP